MEDFMPMPPDFKYREAYLKGRPHHDKYDTKHPAMDQEHRAKIFSPFDALRGFDLEIEKVAREAGQEE